MKAISHLFLVLALAALGVRAIADGDGPRESFDGYRAFPDSPEQMQQRIDQRDLHGATQAYLWSMNIATMLAWEEANLKVADHLDLVTYITPFEKRDIITANATTPYAVAYVDLSRTDGMVEITVPAGPVGGLINDGQMRSVVDIGIAGPDGGKGGRYLILGPGVEEPSTHDADHVVRSKSNLLLTGFRVLAGDDEARDALFQGYKLNPVGEPSTTKVVSIGDTPYRGCNLRGMDHWRELHRHMQREHFGPADAMALQFLKRLGIEKGKPFAPDERQIRILTQAEQEGFEMSVALSAARERDVTLRSAVFYEGRTWSNPLSVTDIYDHIDENGVMELDVRTSFGHEAITMSEGMTAQLVGVGSKYLAAYRDEDGNYLNSAYDYMLLVPADPPAEQFWSLTAYNAKTRAMVYTERKDVSSRQDLHINPDGSVPVYISSHPDRTPHPQNCLDVKGQGDIFVYFRVYAPTKAYFEKTWQLPDIKRLETPGSSRGISTASDEQAALDIAAWAMPVVSFFAQKEAAYRDMGASPNQILFWSKPLDHNNKILTPNNTVLYVSAQIETFEGPVVLEVPPTEGPLGIFGSLVDPFMVPLEDIGGSKGIDRGLGGKILITPPGYTGEIPEGHLHVPSMHFNTVAGLRVTPESFEPDDVRKAVAYVKRMKLYPLGSSEPTVFVDGENRPFDPRPPYDENFFRLLDIFIQTESFKPIDREFIANMGVVGIAKGRAFTPQPLHARIAAANWAHLQREFRSVGERFFPGSQWTTPVKPSESKSRFTYVDEHGNYDWRTRAQTFHWAIWAPKHLGTDTFYLIGQRDSEGNLMDSQATYTLVVPPDVPAEKFWSVTMYEMETGGTFFDYVPTVAASSKQEDLVYNDDGSVTLTFGPRIPAGSPRANHVPTRGSGSWFTLFRWYGPEPALFPQAGDARWVLGDFRKMESNPK